MKHSEHMHNDEFLFLDTLFWLVNSRRTAKTPALCNFVRQVWHLLGWYILTWAIDAYCLVAKRQNYIGKWVVRKVFVCFRTRSPGQNCNAKLLSSSANFRKRCALTSDEWVSHSIKSSRRSSAATLSAPATFLKAAQRLDELQR